MVASVIHYPQRPYKQENKNVALALAFSSPPQASMGLRQGTCHPTSDAHADLSSSPPSPASSSDPTRLLLNCIVKHISLCNRNVGMANVLLPAVARQLCPSDPRVHDSVVVQYCCCWHIFINLAGTQCQSLHCFVGGPVIAFLLFSLCMLLLCDPIRTAVIV